MMDCNASLMADPGAEATNNVSCILEDGDQDVTIHAFNASNVDTTVIEKIETVECKNNSCEGSDSGVEVIESACNLQRTVSTNSQEFVNSAQSCDSSIISCCSNYDEAFNLLVRRNSTLLDDYKLRNVDGTSENGSESSSVASTKISKRANASQTKKKVILENKRLTSTSSRMKPPPTQKATPTTRSKSTERTLPKTPKSIQKTTRTKPDNLGLASQTPQPKRSLMRVQAINRTPSTTPTEDGRWPSSYTKPATSMTRSLRGVLPLESSPKPRPTTSIISDTRNTLDKYATLPRRRKERSADNITDLHGKSAAKSRENSVTRYATLKKTPSRDTTPVKTLPPYPKKKQVIKTKIYHETSVQTALNLQDIENALAGINFEPKSSEDVEKCCKEVQVDYAKDEIESLQNQLDLLKEKYESLSKEHAAQGNQLKENELKLEEERVEKEGLREELKNNNERVIAMLGQNNSDENNSDSLMVLESQFQNVSSIIVKQEEEISKLNMYCRALQRDFDKSLANQCILKQQHQELEEESKELQEFLHMEKTTLSEALKDSEFENKRNKSIMAQKEKELEYKQDECNQLKRISEQRRQENVALQARFRALEAKCRELLVHQGSAVSGAAVALSALLNRLDCLINELVSSYSISEQELDDVIFHNEAYSNSSSSPDVTPDKCRKFIVDKTQSPKRGSSFVSAVINAIRSATAQSPFTTSNRENSKDNITDNSDSTELLDSETEPCLMMEHVLEDVFVPDGHSHNMISSGHSLTSSLRLSQSESLNSIPQMTSNRSNMSSLTDFCSVSLVDQIIDVDNLVTRLLKVIRIIQLANEDYIVEEREIFADEMKSQRDTNKIVVKQLKDWEILGAKLKGEVSDLLHQLGRKNSEFEDIRNELNQQRVEVEKLNQDVCDLSTALSKSEREIKVKEEEGTEALKRWEATGEVPSAEVMGKLVISLNEVPTLEAKLVDKEKHLNELTLEYIAYRQTLQDNLNEALNEAKKQYDAIDNALEILHDIQPVVQQCAPLAKLQQDLEEASFQSASAMPSSLLPDNNSALVRAMDTLNLTATVGSIA
ncbi:PREDICTED: synaptonemal complex protein 1 [Nicrophorus vespilloides]|uniref:Synaptonemal complex protein 1 n=1 Tax=Nicrophorus vespilloides TaxID=110193 RepID=A0ABM1MUR6_NICVS|nr:PREDICTED: synaptonemal complex protein 1 [Nicrophorus vespilloides]